MTTLIAMLVSDNSRYPAFRAAELLGLSISAYICMAVNEWMERSKKERNTPGDN